MRSFLVLALLASPALAGRHVVQRGETLEYVARVYGCSTDVVLRANKLNTTLVPPGTVVTIPTCNVASRTKTRARATSADNDLDARAERALAVIDGTAVVKSARAAEIDRAEPTESVGQPWNGRLINGEALPAGDGYRVRRPHRAYGASHVVEHLQTAIAAVRVMYDVHTLAIGDLSARGGGKIGDHHSHQSGLDVDVGFYFHRMPEGYPDAFADASSDLDLEANWALLAAFVRTMDQDTGVHMIFLDYEVQARLYKFAKKRGTPDADLAAIFQYPRGKDTLAGLVRHWPNHADHFHVRFKPGH
ncbi:MAG: penicillin-insensitive murein endopeptidase [Kofleriaceae bacterium]|nr:penicillin-insensitive murein endopeptidase [Kofleriaceae bacterium]